MIIGINGYEAVVPRFGFTKDGLPNRVGSGEVCFQWMSQLSKIDKKNSYRVYLPSAPASDMPVSTKNWEYKIIKSKKLWTLFGLSKALRKESDLDVFFSPTHYAPFFVRCPQVISILDVSYKHFPQMYTKKDLYKLALWGKYSVKKATKIVTISSSSKNDIINEYGVASEKVVVAPLGIKENPDRTMSKEDISKKYSITFPYILFVGTIQPRKNIQKLIEAFEEVSKKEHDLKLIVIGKKGWHFEKILNAPEQLGIKNRVIFLHNVEDDELSKFYKNAEMFVLPSLYEGFGLPILEAMKNGCPVITSNVSSLPEAGGDAAIYVDPNKAEDIRDAIFKISNDKQLRENMVKKGYEQTKKFSWEKSVRKVLEALEAAGGKNGQ